MASQNGSEERGIPITRSDNLPRFYADECFVLVKGLEFDLSFLVFGPDPVFRKIPTGTPEALDYVPGATRMSPSVVEIARVRMDEDTTANFAMHLLDRIVSTGRVDIAAFRKNIDNIISRAPQPDSDNEGSSEALQPQASE